MKQPMCLILVGVPGSGKSTWAKKCLEKYESFGYTSTDEWIELIAAKSGMTYNEAFKDNMDDAVDNMLGLVKHYIENNQTFIWDQTSVNVKSRRKKLVMLPKHYEKIAVVFPTPEPEELQMRLDSRHGKSIPKHVMESMINTFVMPKLEEGFDLIINGDINGL